MNINPFLIVRIMYRIQCFLMHPWCSMSSVLVHLNPAFLPLERPRTQAHLLQPRRSRAWPGAEQVNGALSVAALTGIWEKMVGKLVLSYFHYKEIWREWKKVQILNLCLSYFKPLQPVDEGTDIRITKICATQTRMGAPLWDSVQVPLQDWIDSPGRELERIDSLNKKKRYRGVDAIFEVSTANHWTKWSTGSKGPQLQAFKMMYSM